MATTNAPISTKFGHWLTALGLFAVSFYLFHLFGSHHASLPLRPGLDPLFGVLPLWDWSALLTYGWLAFHAAAALSWLAYDRGRLPYILATIGLFMLVRNLFIVSTPVGPPEQMIPLYTDAALAPLRGTLFFDNELFFSGHTGVPFLYFLLCPRPALRRGLFLAASAVMAAGVLVTRNHYTIDVLGAYFITYAVYRLSLFLFRGMQSPPLQAEAG